LRRAKDRCPPSLVRFGGAMVRDWQRVEPFDRSMTLAAQAFTSIFPLVMVAMSILQRPDAHRLGDRLAEAFALPPSTRNALEDALPDDGGQAATFGLVGLLIVLLSATSFSRALSRMYAKVWSVRYPGWNGPSGVRWIVVILVIAASALGLQAVQHAVDDTTAGTVGALLLTFVVNAVLWTWVPFLLLAKRVPWQLMAPAGVIMGAASVALGLGGAVYLPRALDQAADHFGGLGVAFTAIGWLFCVAFALIASTVVGAVLAREPGPMARWLAPYADNISRAPEEASPVDGVE
jgi:membrane protein